MIGEGNKLIQSSALENFNVVKNQSLRQQKFLKEIIFQKNLIFLRPAGGIKPFEIEKLINKSSKNSYDEGEQISPSELT